jgi:hypothetical protein
MALDVVDVINPCTQSWENMAGSGRMRFCEHCQKNVHNLSAMPTAEAERLLCAGAGVLCVRFEATRDGKIRTLDYQRPTARKGRIWPLWTLAGACATFAAAAMNIVLARPKPFVTGAMVMGVPPPPPLQMTMGSLSRPGMPTTQPTTRPGISLDVEESTSEGPSPKPSDDNSR